MALGNEINITNKLKRQEIFADIKHEKNKERHTMRRKRAKEERENPELREQRLKENVTQTIENTRVYDETINKEVEGDEDDLMRYFNSNSNEPPKIFLTTNVNAKKSAYEFANILIEILPNVTFVKRKFGYKLKEISDICIKRNFTDIVIINEDKKKVTGLTFIHLPEGPTFYFKLSSFVEVKKIVGHGRPTSHIPELILNNFQTRLGQTVGRLFQSILPQNPDIEGRQVITLHNQRDYIFFRRHRYVFKDNERVGLQELGPQFTLKLKRLQRGIKEETEWEHKPEMDKEKKKFYL
ncbi:AQG_2a_G0024650.mRNA.1.CDS.1 [Saccharomyces cerevisiae]|jgi:ribosome production factor 1|uniref:Ribosome production factor 1 n=10 Tax=Saccharomyces TaxID=4930 RepID=RPF1_YEAST|nr:rRNA-binding ribosome biosynthesis protein RPF1 [Saccharomyces cerevisiae S288C]P38805.1 RecName: Full=Ribosome production factor 1; AltName: Full=Ribosome biogenesis protein RPF1 [Saccharomyces cerevisiae S288C]5Z3G_O Chain O, Ribosome production factor 1 [Saccharomyces cerevisiae S288C]6C0F_I Chain I, Ribosome production factor 1 [Saccharomyces cerevisiae BY4741]6CB1_I Chain I, Ribosome production factor 1 [Saccharomyces cerevisiae BY4741]6EM1_x Chain x, Ribosome production factor 1 [Sacc|eukprot:NP_011956.1 rRNA-binding ribosome biosynthesis protein RPF1 [Saccharomyces cerevisiae S288C]